MIKKQQVKTTPRGKIKVVARWPLVKKNRSGLGAFAGVGEGGGATWNATPGRGAAPRGSRGSGKERENLD